MKKQDEAKGKMSGFLDALMQDSDYVERIAGINLESLGLLEQGVLFWHCQRYQFQKIMQEPDSQRFLPVSTDALFNAPEDTLMSISDHLGLDLPLSLLAEVVASGSFRLNAKTGAEYGPEQQKKEAQQVGLQYQAEIQAAMKWAAPLLEQLPIAPLSGEEISRI
ncbi:MAG: hypothetical protein WBG86_02525 [Polyangiales bacterium]